jgi:hypothetical protein
MNRSNSQIRSSASGRLRRRVLLTATRNPCPTPKRCYPRSTTKWQTLARCSNASGRQARLAAPSEVPHDRLERQSPGEHPRLARARADNAGGGYRACRRRALQLSQRHQRSRDSRDVRPKLQGREGSDHSGERGAYGPAVDAFACGKGDLHHDQVSRGPASCPQPHHPPPRDPLWLPPAERHPVPGMYGPSGDE